MNHATKAKSAAPSKHRRQLLQGLAALAASGHVPAGLAQATSAATFTSMSTTLTGNAYTDPAIAAALLRALSSAVGAAKLAKIASLALTVDPGQLGAAFTSAGLEEAAATVVAALFSGVVDTPKGPVVITYNNALAWQAVTWTKPNAECGGATNYWAGAPAGVTK